MNELRTACRALVKTPGFLIIGSLTLALGIGATTIIYSVVQGVLLRPLPFRDESTLAWVWSTRPDRDRAFFSILDFEDTQRNNRTVADMAGLAPLAVNLTGQGEAERVLGARVTPNFFPLLGAVPALGHLPQPGEIAPGAAPVAVLGHGYWQRRFGGDAAILGRTLLLNGEPHTVVAVLGPDFVIPNFDSDLILLADFAGDARRTERNTSFLRAVVRLRPGVSLAQAREDFARVNDELVKKYPETNATKTAPRFIPLRAEITGLYRQNLLVLLGASILLLVLMGANLAGLLTVRSLRRLREAALRTALGATPRHLLRLFVAEGLILALAGGALGVALAAWGLPQLLRFAPADLPRIHEISVDRTVLLLSGAVTLLIGFISGFIPAIGVAHLAPNTILKSGALGGGAPGRTGALLVAAQVALSLTLLIAAGLFVRTLDQVRRTNPGFNPENVLTMQVALPAGRYGTLGLGIRYVEDSLSRLRNLPGVRLASFVTILPLSGVNSRAEFTNPEHPPADPAKKPSTRLIFVSEDFFTSLGITLREGRDFTAQDAADRQQVGIIDETFARQQWPNESPLGKRIRLEDNPAGPREMVIVGVVAATKHFSLEEKPVTALYMPFRQFPVSNAWLFNVRMNFALRTDGEPLVLARLARAALGTVDLDVPVLIRSLHEATAWTIAPRFFSVNLLGFFAGSALLLAALGLFAIVAQLVTARTREIGIRLALGAQRPQVMQHVLGRGLQLVAFGLAAGWVLALLAARLFSRLLYGVGAFDLPTYLIGTALVLAAALLACWLPARRATKVDPLVALRNE